MEETEKKLLEEYMEKDHRLKTLVDEHRRLEKQITKLAKKPHLTADEEALEKQLKKEKLIGRDHIDQILRQYKL